MGSIGKIIEMSNHVNPGERGTRRLHKFLVCSRVTFSQSVWGDSKNSSERSCETDNAFFETSFHNHTQTFQIKQQTAKPMIQQCGWKASSLKINFVTKISATKPLNVSNLHLIWMVIYYVVHVFSYSLISIVRTHISAYDFHTTSGTNWYTKSKMNFIGIYSIKRAQLLLISDVPCFHFIL